MKRNLSSGVACESAGRPPNKTMPQPLWGCESSVTFPRVARPSQPWALLRNPFGIEDAGKKQLLTALHAALLSILIFWPCSNTAAAPARQLKLLTPSGYLPQLPLLVRVEGIDSTGRRDWSLWDAEATLTSDSQGVSLSTNRVVLRNGLGSVLVSFSGNEDFNLIA